MAFANKPGKSFSFEIPHAFLFAGSGELSVANSKQWSQIVDDHSYANKLETLGVLHAQFLNQLLYHAGIGEKLYSNY